MKRIAALEEESTTGHKGEILVASISKIISSSDMPRPAIADTFLQEESIQKWIRFVRTDLDEFSPTEVRAIYHHGVEVGTATAKTLRVADKDFIYAPPSEWDPCSRSTALDDLVSKIAKYPDRIREIARRPLGVAPSDARSPDRSTVDRLRASRALRLRLWNTRDPVCWLVAVALLILICTLISMLLLSHSPSNELSPREKRVKAGYYSPAGLGFFDANYGDSRNHVFQLADGSHWDAII